MQIFGCLHFGSQLKHHENEDEEGEGQWQQLIHGSSDIDTSLPVKNVDDKPNNLARQGKVARLVLHDSTSSKRMDKNDG
ncbi:hypothetical protein GOBAR_DD19761 [Gossypium barbadense]|nr:hypothetical protein GOBAR_DD19761 [Gossypium barbadense]